MAEAVESFDDVQVSERIQPISVRTEYYGRFKSDSFIRDLPPLVLDEPTELGGEGAGPTALETVLAAFNACSGMIMNIYGRQIRFKVKRATFETQGFIDVRRVEAKRLKVPWTEVEPLAEHYYRVVQKVIVYSDESPEKFEELRAGVEKLCPMQALFRDAKVPLQAEWLLVRD